MKSLKIWLNYLYEGVFLYIIMDILYIITNHLAPVLPFLMIVLINGIAFVLITKKKAVPYPFILSLILLCIIVGYLTGFNLYSAVLSAVVIAWRAYVLLLKDDIDDEQQHSLFLISLFLCITVYLVFSGFDQKGILLVLPVIQFFYLIGLKMFDLMLSQDFRRDPKSRKYFIWGFSTFGTAVLLSVLAVFMFPALKSIVTTVFSWVGSAVGFIIINPIIWLFNLLITEDDVKEAKVGKLFEQSEEEKKKMTEQIEPASSSLNTEMIFLAVVIIAFIILFIYFFKKKMRIDVDPSHLAPSKNNVMRSQRDAKNIFQRRKPPKDIVRRRFFQLQKILAKQGFGRNPNESVEDWFSRMAIDTPGKGIVASSYRKVRYGGKSLSEAEMERFESAVKEMIETAEDRKKNKD